MTGIDDRIGFIFSRQHALAELGQVAEICGGHGGWVEAGGSYFMGRADNNPNTYYEVKYKDPNGVVFDLTHSGWKGAVKEVVQKQVETGIDIVNDGEFGRMKAAGGRR